MAAKIGEVFISQMLLKKRQRPLPSQFRSRLVVPRRRGVVVKSMLDARVKMLLVLDPGSFQCCFVSSHSRIDSLVIFSIVQLHGGFDFWHVRRLRLPAVKCYGSSKRGHIHRQIVRHGAAPAKADAAKIAVALLPSNQVIEYPDEVLQAFFRFQLREKLPGVVLVWRRAAERRQGIWRNCQVARLRCPPRNILNVSI